ncbi:hypothetical protein M9978_02570 [Sphingomonas sp. MG17]|uniref:Uncharacterized protein n=1 Tax=Sphingomonas tagetis TaxID=2949092 RepID=A0A9X2HDV4_9SPHN|nr:hypothetical protein [Sphingomonas tagetis]MCP3729301.1 hypothetical protein [Sphingomonas tagetis]
MPCQHVTVPGAGAAIVCSPTRRCACGKRATLQCDWKVPTRRSGTCDRYICSSCTTSPAPDKDLCKEHGAAWAEWQARR